MGHEPRKQESWWPSRNLPTTQNQTDLPKFQKVLTFTNAVHLQIGSTHIVFN